MKRVGIGVAVVLGLVALFGIVTAIALESGGVAVLETQRPDGSVRETHVWYVDDGGQLWVEAGAPGNGWFLDVQREPRLVFRSDTRDGTFVAVPDPSRARHAWLRERLAERYGWRDAWVSQLVDASHSSAVRLDPAEPEDATP